MAAIVRLKPERCVFLLCDVQERFRGLITKFDAVVTGAQRMLGACNELRIPVLVTEQYPKALGHTVAELDVSGEGTRVFEKVRFSMLSDDVSAALADRPFDDAIIVGLEAHVCVQQTTLDLLGMGKRVHLCVDAISSQTAVDRAAGLHRLASSGALVTTTEARRHSARATHACSVGHLCSSGASRAMAARDSDYTLACARGAVGDDGAHPHKGPRELQARLRSPQGPPRRRPPLVALRPRQLPASRGARR